MNFLALVSSVFVCVHVRVGGSRWAQLGIIYHSLENASFSCSLFTHKSLLTSEFDSAAHFGCPDPWFRLTLRECVYLFPLDLNVFVKMSM